VSEYIRLNRIKRRGLILEGAALSCQFPGHKARMAWHAQRLEDHPCEREGMEPCEDCTRRPTQTTGKPRRIPTGRKPEGAKA